MNPRSRRSQQLALRKELLMLRITTQRLELSDDLARLYQASRFVERVEEFVPLPWVKRAAQYLSTAMVVWRAWKWWRSSKETVVTR